MRSTSAPAPQPEPCSRVLRAAEEADSFFFDSDLDRATDLKDEAFANDLDFILA
jgi:hypothetical protein